MWRAEILGFGCKTGYSAKPNQILIHKQHFTRISARLFTTVKSWWNPWTAVVFTLSLLALIRMRTRRNLRQILGFHTHTRDCLRIRLNPDEILGFQNPRLSAVFKNCLWIPMLVFILQTFPNKYRIAVSLWWGNRFGANNTLCTDPTRGWHEQASLPSVPWWIAIVLWIYMGYCSDFTVMCVSVLILQASYYQPNWVLFFIETFAACDMFLQILKSQPAYFRPLFSLSEEIRNV